MISRKGIVWRIVHSPPRVKIILYFAIFSLQIIAFSIAFHQFYPILEGRTISWPNALFFVINTVTTTGNFVLPPFQNETTILFVIIMMIAGVVMIFMIIPLLLAPYLMTLLKTGPPRRTPGELKGHVVIIGYGEIARSLVESLMISDLELVIVDDDEKVAEGAVREFAKRTFVVWGDYADQDTWNEAWVANASDVIVCVEERRAATIILGIREMTGGRIIAVVDKLSFDRYLRYAGADHVISPKYITGRILARHAVIGSHVDSLMEGPAPSGEDVKSRLVQIPIMPGSKAAGRQIRDLDLFAKYGFFIPFLSKGGHFIMRPPDDLVTDLTTRLFLIGDARNVALMMENEFIRGDGDGALAVIAGYGDVGASVYDEMTSRGISCVVVDQKRYPLNEVIGNAEDEEVLREARIENAKFCVVALNDDNVNIFTTLMARDMNPDIRILARANEPGSVDRLYRAGADYVALLPVIGGQVIAGVILSEIVTIILDLPNGQKVVKKRMAGHPGETVGWVRKHTGTWIIAIEDEVRSVVNPGPDEVIGVGETVTAIGDPDQLKQLIRIL